MGNEFNDDDHKNNQQTKSTKSEKENLAWFHRTVPNCCCAPHHPHLSQDKLLLLQNGQIINRSMIDSLEEIQHTLHEMRNRQHMLQKQKLINSTGDEAKIYDQIQCDDESDVESVHKNNDNENKDNMESIPYVRFNDFGSNKFKKDDQYKQKFKNKFPEHEKPKINQTQQNNFSSPRYSKANNLNKF